MKATRKIINALNAIEFGGKTPWLVVEEDVIVFAGASRVSAREAKTEKGKVCKLEDLGITSKDIHVSDDPVVPFKGPARIEMKVFEALSDIEGAGCFGVLNGDEIVTVYSTREEAPDADLVFIDGSTEMEVYSDSPLTPEEAEEPKKARTPRKPALDGPRKSTIEKPTKRVWAIADAMFQKNPEVTRKEIVETCIKEGIARNTASTQHYHWRQVNKHIGPSN